ncbi:MAG: hypothetical protein ACJA2G_002971, partial [Cognaticolwellia sp.]
LCKFGPKGQPKLNIITAVQFMHSRFFISFFI